MDTFNPLFRGPPRCGPTDRATRTTINLMFNKNQFQTNGTITLIIKA